MRSTLSAMMNSMLNKPKVYGNHPNHPGFTTAQFNQNKVPVGNDRPTKMQPDNAPAPTPPEPNPLTPLGN